MSPSHAKRFLRRMTVQYTCRDDAELAAAVAAERGFKARCQERQMLEGTTLFEVHVTLPRADEDVLWAARVAFRRDVRRRQLGADR